MSSTVMDRTSCLAEQTRHHIASTNARLHIPVGACSSDDGRHDIPYCRFIVRFGTDDFDRHRESQARSNSMAASRKRRVGSAFNWMTVRGVCDSIRGHCLMPPILLRAAQGSDIWNIFNHSPTRRRSMKHGKV
jgi:hypothetical protein